MGGWRSAPTRWPPPGRRAAKRRPRPCYGVECFSVPINSRGGFFLGSLAASVAAGWFPIIFGSLWGLWGFLLRVESLCRAPILKLLPAAFPYCVLNAFLQRPASSVLLLKLIAVIFAVAFAAATFASVVHCGDSSALQLG